MDFQKAKIFIWINSFFFSCLNMVHNAKFTIKWEFDVLSASSEPQMIFKAMSLVHLFVLDHINHLLDYKFCHCLILVIAYYFLSSSEIPKSPFWTKAPYGFRHHWLKKIHIENIVESFLFIIEIRNNNCILISLYLFASNK